VVLLKAQALFNSRGSSIDEEGQALEKVGQFKGHKGSERLCERQEKEMTILGFAPTPILQ